MSVALAGAGGDCYPGQRSGGGVEQNPTSYSRVAASMSVLFTKTDRVQELRLCYSRFKRRTLDNLYIQAGKAVFSIRDVPGAGSYSSGMADG